MESGWTESPLPAPAISSSRYLQQPLAPPSVRTPRGFVTQIIFKYRALDAAFFGKVKDQLTVARNHPFLAGGLTVSAGMLLMRGPRRFLFRRTLGRFQSVEERFDSAESSVKELKLSVDLMKKESAKLLKRASDMENEMKDGHFNLMNTGAKIRNLAKSLSKAEEQATDLMSMLRVLSGEEASKLREEVASMVSNVRQQRIDANKLIMKIHDVGPLT